MAEMISKWAVVNKMIDIENEFQQYKPFHGFEHAMYRKICELEIAIGKTPGVELVRCSECKHWDEIEDTCGGGYCNHSCWFALDAEPPIVNHSDFCSYGERRTDNERKAD